MSENIPAIVDIGEKPIVARRATASGILHLNSVSANAIREKKVRKGNVIEASTIAAWSTASRKWCARSLTMPILRGNHHQPMKAAAMFIEI